MRAQLTKLVATLAVGVTAAVLWLPLTTQAATERCTGNWPADPTDFDTWRANWEVDDWLTYHDLVRYNTNNSNLDDLMFFDPDNFPIGPYQWCVKGKLKNDKGQIVWYEELWTIDRIVMASNRFGSGTYRRGYIEDLSRLPRGNRPYQQVNINGTDTAGSIYSSRNTVLARRYRGSGDRGSHDSAFDAQNNALSPVGLYGVLATSKDNLERSRSAYPIKWNVDGQIIKIVSP